MLYLLLLSFACQKPTTLLPLPAKPKNPFEFEKYDFAEDGKSQLPPLCNTDGLEGCDTIQKMKKAQQAYRTLHKTHMEEYQPYVNRMNLLLNMADVPPIINLETSTIDPEKWFNTTQMDKLNVDIRIEYPKGLERIPGLDAKKIHDLIEEIEALQKKHSSQMQYLHEKYSQQWMPMDILEESQLVEIKFHLLSSKSTVYLPIKFESLIFRELKPYDAHIHLVGKTTTVSELLIQDYVIELQPALTVTCEEVATSCIVTENIRHFEKFQTSFEFQVEETCQNLHLETRFTRNGKSLPINIKFVQNF